jgi:hypothetical protein
MWTGYLDEYNIGSELYQSTVLNIWIYYIDIPCTNNVSY